MGNTTRRQWSEADIETLKRLYPVSQIRMLEKLLDRPRVSIYAKANHLKLSKSSGTASRPVLPRDEDAIDSREPHVSMKERERRLAIVDRTLARMMKREGVCLNTER